MRFSKGLTSPERWDLGLLLVLLMVTSLCLGVLWNYHSVPTLWAQPRQPALDNMARSFTTPTLPVEMSTPLVLDPVPSPPIFVPLLSVAVPKVPVATPVRLTPPKAPKPIPYYWFNGAKYRYWKTMRMHVTAYAPDRRCCWPFAGTTTASGSSVKTNHGHLVAADTDLIPMHALVSIPGYHGGEKVPVLDRGSAITGRRLDVLLPSFQGAQEWGVQELSIKVYLPVND